MFDDSKPSTTSDRFSYALLSLVGEVVAVHLVDGRVVEGIFASKGDDEGLRVVLLQARLRSSSQNPSHTNAECAKVMVLEELDVMMIDAVGAPLRTAAPARGRVEHNSRGQFSGEMKRWAEMADDDVNEVLEEDNHREGSWDQFATNQQKFGVQTSYSEEHYTTKLDKKKLTAEQQRKAEEIEKGILARGTKGIQHEIERGGTVVADEGTAFSDVQRAPLPQRSTGAYVPPSQRNKQAPASPTPQGTTPAPAPQSTQPAPQPQVQPQAPAPAAPKVAQPAPQQPATSPVSAGGGGAGGLRASAAEWRPPSAAVGGVDAEYNTETLPDNNDFMKAVTEKMKLLRQKILTTNDVAPLLSREWPGDDNYPEDQSAAYYPPPMHHAHPQMPAPHHQPQHHAHHQHHHMPPPHNQNFNHYGGGGGGGGGHHMGGQPQGFQNQPQQSFVPQSGGNFQSPHNYTNNYGDGPNPNSYAPRVPRNTPPMNTGPMGMGNGPMHGDYPPPRGGYQDPMQPMNHGPAMHQNPSMSMHGGHGGSQHPGMNQGQGQYPPQMRGAMHSVQPPQPMINKTMSRGGMSHGNPAQAHPMPQQPQQPQQPQAYQQAPPQQQSAPPAAQEAPKRVMSRGRGGGPAVPESAAAPPPQVMPQAAPAHNQSNPPGASVAPRGRGGKR